MVNIASQKSIKSILIGLVLSCISVGVHAATVCTNYTRVEGLWARDGGWVHVRMQNVANGDISGCGNGGSLGLLLNFNDTVGTYEGKKMLLDILLDAKKTGDLVKFCSSGCDTQYPNYSRLSYIDGY